ncbi:MAG: hypothetical protein KGS61_03610 [Verrucomicrobia bacterium]|nr:hypothetical protein [Verrucomicrobiota bacterium]
MRQKEAVIEHYAPIFWELMRTPFRHGDLIWGIVPLYFGWLTNELTSDKASYKTAIQTGFSFLWAGAHWSWQYLATRHAGAPRLTLDALFAVNVAVTLVVLTLGAVALFSGFRKRYPRFGSFLGHTRFGNYFMIAIFPVQSGYLAWSWDRVTAIGLFAVPIWVLLHFGLMPLRSK